MPKIIIDAQRCKGCFLCVSFCPQQAIKKSSKLNKQGLAFVEYCAPGQNCPGCAQCALVCPEGCIRVIK